MPTIGPGLYLKRVPIVGKLTFTEEEKRHILRAYRRLLRACAEFLDRPGKAELRRAFRLALERHGDMRRRTGEPYILHPLAVAHILVKEIGLKDKGAVIAALFHDLVEDTDTSLELIAQEFGPTIARLVEALTKIQRVRSPLDSEQAETFRKILLTMADDIRVALIKLADRLHNLRTLQGLHPDKQAKILAETEYIYIPIAHRLGLYEIRSEMEDIILQLREPEAYQEIAQKLQETAREREKYIQRFIQPIEERLRAELAVPYKIESRIKSLSSIYQKMKRQGVRFEEVYDIFAVRLILDSPPETEKADCWRAYSIVTSLYRPNLNRLRDWISQPKPTGYEALHVTVMGPEGKWVEVQIRSRRMHEAAEYGLVAHWRYKQAQNGRSTPRSDEALEAWLNRIRSLLENPELSSIDLLSELHPDITHEEVYVFTPKGDLKVLPAGATVLDFAYEIHSEIGRHAIAAKVNGKPVLLNYVLQNADQVEVITSERAEPTEEQLTFVRTGRARLKIREYLKQQRRQAIEKGREIFEWRLRHLGLRADDPIIRELLWYLRLPSLEELWYRLGTHALDLARVQEFIRLKRLAQHTSIVDQLSQQLGLLSGAPEVGLEEEPHTYATCCYPVPFDSIMGYVSAEGLVIHRTTCKEIHRLLSLDGSKIRPLRWTATPRKTFLAALLLEGEDRQGMLLDIVKVISLRKRKNIRSIRIEGKASYFQGIMELYVYNEQELVGIIRALSEVRGLLRVQRYQVGLNGQNL